MSKTSITNIVLDGRKILIAKRNPTGQMGGRWEFPGGKVEQGESDKQACKREFKEEFGVNIKADDLITITNFKHNGEIINLHAYRVYVPHKGKIIKYKLTEHSEYKWVDIGDIPKLNFVDSDLLLYPEIKKYTEQKSGLLK